ncbi:AbgT family transporter [bacterium]|nr:AbgT family transporter [bacterium]
MENGSTEDSAEKKGAVIGLRVLLFSMVILGTMIILAGLSSYFIQAGKLTNVTLNGTKQQVYQVIEQTPVPVWKIVLSPILSLTGKDGPKIIVLILFIFIIGGSFSVLNKSGVLPGILSNLTRKFFHRKTLFLITNVVIFSLLGSCLGIIEEVIPLVLIFIPLSYRMGWDSITGLAIPILSTGFGFAAATFNPFTIGTAQKLADIALFSGLSIRLPFFIVSTTVVVLYLLYYTRKIEANPEKSPTYEMDKKIKASLYLREDIKTEKSHTNAVIWIVFCLVLVFGVVLGGMAVPILQTLAFPLIALVFLIMGIGSGFLSGNKAGKVLSYFLQGLADFAPAIILILMAAAVGYLVHEGNVLGTILYSVSNQTKSLSKETSILVIYGFQMLLNALIPSGSGQAVLTIPILAPLGDILNISRQTIVLAFQFGDGFSNVIWPTNPGLLVAIGLARVSYKDWFRFILPIQLILFILCCLTLLIAVNINYV